jgi:uncharacterized protein (DUF433 family)
MTMKKTPSKYISYDPQSCTGSIIVNGCPITIETTLTALLDIWRQQDPTTKPTYYNRNTKAFE